MAKKKIKRSISKITLPKEDLGSKDKMKAFRCSKLIADLLDKEENQSETINKALLAYFGKDLDTCPTCREIGLILKRKKAKV
jgi:hypothetical protein